MEPSPVFATITRCCTQHRRCAPVAQRLEQQTHNLLVRGSNPRGGTKDIADFRYRVSVDVTRRSRTRAFLGVLNWSISLWSQLILLDTEPDYILSIVSLPNDLSKKTRRPGASSGLREQLATLDKSELLDLVKELYETSTDNRDFIQARCQVGQSGGEALEKYRAKIVKQFYPKRDEPKLKLSEARQAINDYLKATGNVPGAAELMMTYVENGAEFTRDYGDIDEEFYDSVESVLNELATLLLHAAPELYPQFSERLAGVEQITDGMGWGFHDHIADVVAQLEDELGDR